MKKCTELLIYYFNATESVKKKIIPKLRLKKTKHIF